MNPTLVNRWVGVPTSTGFTVSTQTTGAQTIRIKVGTDSAVTQNVTFSSSTGPDSDGWVKTDVTGLLTATQYYYKVEMTPTGGGAATLSTETGKCKTLPTPNQPANFSFAFGSCMSSGSTITTAMNLLKGRSPDLFLHLGDFHYSNSISTSQAAHRQDIESQIAANSGLRAVLAEIPSYYMKSDHDAGGGNNGAPGAYTAPNRAAHLQIVPTPTLVNTDGLYYSVVVGRVRIIFTDTRYLRSDPAATDNSSKSMLGTAQKAWFKNELTQPEPVKIWAQDAPYVTSDATGDKWANYSTERNELRDYILANASSIKKLITVHGDMHAVGADNGTNNAWGSFPSFCAAPFANTSSIKGGPWSAGTYPAAGISNTSQYGMVQVTDNGTNIDVQFNGYDSANTSRVSLLVSTTEVYDPGAAPAIPTGLSAAAVSSSEISVSWDSTVGATGYDLEVDGTIVDKGTALTHQHTSLIANTSHNYRIRAKNSYGTSAWSSIVSATTLASGSGYATITLTGSLVRAEQATGDSLVVNVPAGAQVGEILIAQISSSTTAVVGPAGWTQIAQANNSTAPISSTGYYRVVTGTEAASYTWTGMSTDRSTGIMQRFAGVDTTTPIDVAAATAITPSTSTTLTLPSITTVTNGAMLIGGITLDASTGAIIVTPVDMTALTQTTGTGRRSTLGYQTLTAAGATGTRIWTMDPTTTLRHFAGWHCALRPAPLGDTPPAIPTGLTAVAASNSQINISWNSVASATGYDLEIDGTIVDKATALSHQHTGLTTNTSYNYRIRAKNANGTSAWSSIVSATTNASTNTVVLKGAGTPFNSAATTNYTLSTHSNTAVGDLLVATITIDELASLITVTPPAGWTAAFTPLQSGSGSLTHAVYWRAAANAGAQTHTFTLSVAYKGSGNIATFSGADTTAPFASSVTAQGTGNVSLSLTTPSANNCMIIAGLAVNHDALTYTYSTPTDWTNDWTITGQQASLFYHQPTLQTTATTASFASTISPANAQRWIGWIAAIKPLSPPSTPTNLAATGTGVSSINVSWNSSATTTSYDLEVDGAVIDMGIALSYSHTGLAGNSTHSYRVRAKNAIGASAWSSIVSATTQTASSSGSTGTVGVRGLGTGFNSVATTNYVLTTPGNTAIGDLLIATITIDLSITTITAPSGWTASFATLQPAGGVTYAAYWRFASSAGTTSHTFTIDTARKGSGNIAAFYGVDTTNPFAGLTSITGTTNVSISLATPTADNCLIIGSFGADHSGSTYSYSTPSGWTNDWTLTGEQINLFYHQSSLQTTATATNFSSTISPTNTLAWGGWLAAIRPAPTASRVVDVWEGSTLVRRRLERWNGAGLINTIFDTHSS